MGLKKYILASAVFIILVTIYIEFVLNIGNYTMFLLGIPINFPISIWIGSLLSFLFIASLIHMIFYSLSAYFREKKSETDFKNFLKLLKSSILKESSNIIFKTDRFKNLATLFSNADLTLKNSNFQTGFVEIDDAISKQSHLENGEFIKDLKVQKDSYFAIKNLENAIELDSKKGLDIIKNYQNYQFETVKKAYLKLLKDGHEKDLKKSLDVLSLDKEMLFESLNRLNQLSIDKKQIINLIKSVKSLTVLELLEISKILKSTLQPDIILEIFEELSKNIDDNDTYEFSYVALLLDYGMVDRAKEIIFNDEVRYMKFKAYLELKELNKKYPLSIFL